MASGGMDTGAGDAVSRQELFKLQQDLALAATSFTEMKTQIAGLEAQLQQATLREQTKSTAHAHKPEPFRGHATTTSLGSWMISLSTYLEATNADPTRWVVLASTYLTESAAVWYGHRVHDLQAAGILDTWDAFCQDLIKTFQPISHMLWRGTPYTSYIKQTRCNSSTLNFSRPSLWCAQQHQCQQQIQQQIWAVAAWEC
jgi:hypothetical protein